MSVCAGNQTPLIWLVECDFSFGYVYHLSWYFYTSNLVRRHRKETVEKNKGVTTAVLSRYMFPLPESYIFFRVVRDSIGLLVLSIT